MNHDWLTHLKNSPVAAINPHLLQDEKKVKKARKVRKDAHQVIWLKEQMQIWCKEKHVTLLTEHKFHDFRKFSFDFAIVEMKVAIEFEGGIWLKGGGAHSRPQNIERDIEKYNLAQSMGWRVIRVHTKNYQNILTELNSAFA